VRPSKDEAGKLGIMARAKPTTSGRSGKTLIDKLGLKPG
jgi:hypothetical protein